jgi:hypothetical protein
MPTQHILPIIAASLSLVIKVYDPFSAAAIYNQTLGVNVCVWLCASLCVAVRVCAYRAVIRVGIRQEE